ncbi:putative FAD-linked oxidoreductase YvdP [Neofusicoccum parvum]|nr:putative FAD-linked oxidoreductase YvdP [Neofusicoccum parvum]
MPLSTTLPTPPLSTPTDPTYAALLTRTFNARLPPSAPSAIACPTTTAAVATTLRRAAASAQSVGVRSGGHNFAAPSLAAAAAGGLLLDTVALNTAFDYDPRTRLVAFGPAATGVDFVRELRRVGRFFPFGHSPSVGVGGFLTAGGQGWFMRGWGATCDAWVERMEIVTADGVVRVASRTEHEDLFWAARGGGLAFFGVVTRVWGRTVPMRKVWSGAVVFAVGDGFGECMEWVMETNERSPKYGVETAVVTCYPDRGEGEGDEVVDRNLLMVVNCTAWADSLEEASVLLSPWEKIPEHLEGRVVARVPVKETSWEELFEAQDQLNPSGNGERWQCDSIFNDPKVDRKQLIEAITPAFCDLPTRKSVGCMYISDYYPNEEDQAMCLPQQYHISTMTCWHDPAKDAEMKKWIYDAYSRAQPVSCGQYVADFDETHRITRVMTDNALKRFLQIREKYDPQEMFVGYRGLAKILSTPTKL